MPDLNDFYSFKMSGGDSDGGEGGCLRPILFVVVIIAILGLIGRCNV